MISLDSCFNAFSREEVLSGNDQWYCNKCKEQRDINKKLELYRLPKILIIQLKRFQSQKSNSQNYSGRWTRSMSIFCLPLKLVER